MEFYYTVNSEKYDESPLKKPTPMNDETSCRKKSTLSDEKSIWMDRIFIKGDEGLEEDDKIMQ